MATDLSQYRDLYIQTAKDLMNIMVSCQDKLEKNSDDKDALSEIHRSAHSLKSQSLVMGYPQMGLLNKQLEALFLQIKDKKIEMSPNILKLVKESLTNIDCSIERIENGQEELDMKSQIEEVEQITHISN